MNGFDKNDAFGNDWLAAYNAGENDEWREPIRGGKMRKTLTTIRCVPRYGYDHTQVRVVDVELHDVANAEELRGALELWFAQRGIADAVYDIAVDDNGYFAVVNDEAYYAQWGEKVL